jgi:hypothetical protein
MEQSSSGEILLLGTCLEQGNEGGSFLLALHGCWRKSPIKGGIIPVAARSTTSTTCNECVENRSGQRSIEAGQQHTAMMNTDKKAFINIASRYGNRT